MAYSKGLRERVVAAVEQDGLSRRAAAWRFGVGVSTAINWVRAYREEAGRLEPKRRGGRRPRSIRAGHRDWLLARIARGGHTIRGLVADLAEARGLTVDFKTMWKFLRAEGLSFKKTAVASERGRPDVARRRRQWKAHQTKIAPERLVFIDETWTKTDMAALRGRGRAASA